MQLAGPFAMLGHRFDVACPDADVRAAVEGSLRVCARPGCPADVRYDVRRDATSGVAGRTDALVVAIDGAVLGRAGTPAEVVDVICRHANGAAIASSTAPLVLHAAAVARDGRAIVIAGESGAGKTTLAAALLDRGWAYMTDEAVQITGQVVEQGTARDGIHALPYLKPLVHKRPGAGDAIERHHRSPAGPVCEQATPIGALLLLDVEADTPGQRAAAVAGFAFPARDPRAALQVAADLVQHAPVVVLPRWPDPDAAEAAVGSAFGRTGVADGR